MKGFLIGTGLVYVFLGNPAYAVKYIQSPPLTSVVKKSIKNCLPSATVQVPLITWGGDIATIYANGNSKATQGESVFGKLGLNLSLNREDVFSKQVESYLNCQSPFLRGTMGMINLAAPLTEGDSRTKMKVIYQMTWSAGGDAMVVKGNIRSPKQLRGKTIAVQAYGPHVDYLAKVLADAGLSSTDVKIKWVKDLTGTENTPVAAFRETGVDAAMVIIPDALALTSNGTVGTGAEDSVKGAKILLSTKTASRIISDVYAVRSDYFNANKEKVFKFVHGLLKAQEQLAGLMKTKGAGYPKMISSSAQILLDSPQATADTEGMYADANFVGWAGNKAFFAEPSNPRSFDNLTSEIQASFLTMGLISQKNNLGWANWNMSDLKSGLTKSLQAESERFDKQKVAQVVDRKQRQGTLDDGTLYSFEVYFKPNQNSFSSNEYGDAFKKVINLAATYGGALITIEGHSDPLGYLKKKKANADSVVLARIKQSAKNLSLTRANAVRDSLVQYSRNRGATIDKSQFAVVGNGIAKPLSGMCGADPCPPKTKQEWLNNMRVEFKIIQIEAEESVFEPLGN